MNTRLATSCSFCRTCHPQSASTTPHEHQIMWFEEVSQYFNALHQARHGCSVWKLIRDTYKYNATDGNTNTTPSAPLCARFPFRHASRSKIQIMSRECRRLERKNRCFGWSDVQKLRQNKFFVWFVSNLRKNWRLVLTMYKKTPELLHSFR